MQSLLKSDPRRLGDMTLVLVTLILVSYGLVMIYSTGIAVAERTYGDSLYFVKRHLFNLLIALGAFYAGYRLDYRLWRKWLPVMMGGILLLLIAVLLSDLGASVKGGRRWLRVAGIGIQPAEFLKIVLIVYVASYLERKQEILGSFLKGLTPNFLITGLYLFLVMMQPDFGSVALMALTVLVMLYLGGGRIVHISASLLSAALVGYLLIISADYRLKRVTAFLNPWDDPQNSGYQIIQAFIAMGSGGWSGRGLGMSRQKLFFLPEAHTDFIFAIIGEEFGFLGALILVALFSIFLWRGFWIAWNAPDSFARNLAAGLTTLLSLQVLFNMGVVPGLLPTKGLSLPFISYGGSSLVTTLLITGILLNISRTVMRIDSNSRASAATPHG